MTKPLWLPGVRSMSVAPHETVTFDSENNIELLDKLLLHFDQPYADSSLIPFYFMTRAVAGKTRVLIGGDGGDEVQSGYAGHALLPLLEQLKPFSALFKIFKKIVSLASDSEKIRQFEKIQRHLNTPTLEDSMFLWISWFAASNNLYKTPPFKTELENPSGIFKNSALNNKFRVQEGYFKIRMLSDHLRKSDMMSMINSIEYRVPMLDEDFTRLSLSTPAKYKAGLNRQKLILRELHSNIYPKEISMMKKRGFTIPLDSWLGDDNLKYMLNTIRDKNGLVSHYINSPYLDTLKESLLEKRHRYHRAADIYSFTHFKIFYTGANVAAVVSGVGVHSEDKFTG